MADILAEAKGHAFITERDQLIATRLIDEIERLRAAIWAWYDDQHCSNAGLAKIAKEMPIPYVPRQGLDKSPIETGSDGQPAMKLRVGDLVEVEGQRGEIIAREGSTLTVDGHAGIAFASTRFRRRCEPRDVMWVFRRNRIIYAEFE